MRFDIDKLCGLINPTKPGSKEGLRTLLTFLQNDPQVTDIRWAAYMLATVRWECGGRWAPIEEYGKGAGHDYGKEVPYIVGDAVYHNIYYGRGYVQTTWLANYLRMGKAIGLGDELARHPEKALDPGISYAMMSYGMREGLYTGIKLSTYIHDSVTDYVNCRRIINGVDRAHAVAAFALDYEKFLQDSLK